MMLVCSTCRMDMDMDMSHVHDMWLLVSSLGTSFQSDTDEHDDFGTLLMRPLLSMWQIRVTVCTTHTLA